MKIETKYNINDSVTQTRYVTNKVYKIKTIIIDEDGVGYVLSNGESIFCEQELRIVNSEKELSIKAFEAGFTRRQVDFIIEVVKHNL